jgi:hypothetical protein
MGLFDTEYKAIIFYKVKKEVETKYFKSSAAAFLWAKEQCLKNHSLSAQIWEGWSNLLATYKWVGKTLKFNRK